MPDRNQHQHQQVMDLVKAISGQKNIISLQKIYIRITGDAVAGLLLSEIVWGSDHTINPEGWFWKKADDWQEELCLSYAKVKRLADKLKEMGFIETALKKAVNAPGASAAPTTHYRPIMGKITDAILENLEFQETLKSENSKNDSEESAESITSPTTSLGSSDSSNPDAGASDDQPVDKTASKEVNAEKEKPEKTPPVNRDGWLAELEQSTNKQATLVWMHNVLHPNALQLKGGSGFAYMARMAKQVNGYETMAKYLWYFSAIDEPPRGNVLAFIEKAHQVRNNQKGGGGQLKGSAEENRMRAALGLPPKDTRSGNNANSKNKSTNRSEVIQEFERNLRAWSGDG